MNLKELEGLFKLCRKYGLKSYEHNGIVLHFDDEMPEKASKADNAELKTEPGYTDEDVLLWSAGN
jgi:hypothetical protein